jgi:subtilisin family serine protease
VVFVAIVFATLLAGSRFTASAGATDAPRAGSAAYGGGVIVGFHAGASGPKRAPAVVGSNRVTRLAPGVSLVHVRHNEVLPTVRRLDRAQGIRYAEPDYRMREAGLPNDPSFGLQWPFQNTGQTINGTTGSAGADEGVVPAWDVSTGDASVVVGVTDSGLDYQHPDLAANVWSNPGGIGGCPAGSHGYSVVAGTCDPMDDETRYGGHGTHVAGIIGATGNNHVGVAGVNWNTTLLPVKVLNSQGNGTTSQLITALDWLIGAKQAGVNVRVINDSATFVGTAYSQALSDEIDRLGANNILFVTAAGNTGDNNDDPSLRRYPCGYDRPNELCVTASNQRDKLPSWANYGQNTVDLAAPGANVFSTLRGGTYGYMSGGSMAAAEVSGAAALILPTGDQSVTELKADILDHVDVLSSLSGLVRTGGRLDICQALTACRTATFGKTSVGAHGDGLTADRKRVNAYSLGEAGTLKKLRVYLRPTGTAGQQVIKGVIYRDAGGAPGSLLASSNEIVFHSTDPAAWYDLPLAAPLALPPGTYWIGLLSGKTARVAKFRWDSVSASRISNVNSYASGPSNPFGSPASTDAEQMSLYAVYSPAPSP